MILMIATNTQQVLHNWDAMRLQFVFRADSGLHKDLRRIDRAK